MWLLNLPTVFVGRIKKITFNLKIDKWNMLDFIGHILSIDLSSDSAIFQSLHNHMVIIPHLPTINKPS